MHRILSTAILASILSLFVGRAECLASTDTITWGGGNSRTGYQTNHNMDPAVVGSSSFGQIFMTQLPGTYVGAGGANEQIFSQPLVYTPSTDPTQYVFVATTQNNIYKLNAKTGAIVAQRNLHIPFLTADLNGCVDINPTVGVTATGVIDPDTDTWYLTAKTYFDQNNGTGPQGKPNGRYYFHAINVNDLSERPNFPVNLEGTVARNNPVRSFNGGIQHQRPALLHTGQFIYAGFASHCVQYNFTGWIMGWDKTTGAIVERYATEGAGVPNTTPGGGVWMSGGGLASDDAGSMFFATGNGYASQLSTIPVNGHNPPTALEEAAVHMTINSDGSLTITDFFMPYEKTQLDGADRDLGTSPLELLPSQFSCGDIQRIGVVTGKSGKTYWLNLDNLGGYQNGPNKQDNVIQVYQNENSVYAGAGVYPLEGGYIYINVIQYPSHVFKFSCNAGVPSFTKVADSPTNNAYILGVGHGTVTSLNGQPGTGLVWVTDVQGYNLRIYNAIPQNGYMTMIKAFNVQNPLKFTRPVFGNGIVYMGTQGGAIYAFGSPVNLPLNCSSPADFGTSNLNNATASQTVTCLANIAVTVQNITLNGDPNFRLSSAPSVPLSVAAGKTFSFQAYFNPSSVGPLAADVSINTTNNVAGYSTNTPVSLHGTGQSVNPLLLVSPVTLAFPGVVTGASIGGVNETMIFSNQGNGLLNITNILYSLTSETGHFVSANMTSSGPKVGAFTLIGLPTSIPGNSAATVTVNFDTSMSGNFAGYVVVQSNGGNKTFDLVGTSGSNPVAVLEFQTPDGSGWVRYQNGTPFTFGNVTENQTRSLKMRLTNNGTADSAALSLTVSKPPFGVGGIIRANNNVDLAEGTTLQAGQNATATLFCSVPKEQWNTDPYAGSAQWTMNVNDPTFGKQFIQFACEAVSEQAPPLQPNGLGYYRYTGCFKDNNPARQLKTQLYSNSNNTNAMCIAACAQAGFTFCGTEYNLECWGGPNIPVQQVSEADCGYPCAGNINQICGGNGLNTPDSGGSFISLFADSRYFNGNVTSSAPTGPFVNPGVGGYSSIGCYSEGNGVRALQKQVTNTPQTVANCINSCSAGTYQYAGLEYGGECWCGNTYNGAGPAAASACNMPCNDNQTEYCGAGNILNMYLRGNGTIPTPTSAPSSSSSAGSVATNTIPAGSVPTGGPQAKQVIGNWTYQGCFTEATNGRALSSSTYASDSMTLESCASYCNGYKLFGVEYGRECYCGNSLAPGSVNATNQGDCSFSCPGAGTELCGAGNRLSLYQTNQTIVVPPAPSIVPSTGTYNYYGCYTEATSARALAGASYTSSKNMTVPNCAAYCSGWTFFGVEYAQECYCGNSFSTGSTLTSDKDCSMICSGDAGSYCGAGNRLNVYINNGTKAAAASTSTSSTASSVVSTSSSSSSSSSSTSSSTYSSSTSSSSSSGSSSSSTSSTLSPTSSSTSSSQSSTSTPSSSSSSSSTTSKSSSISSSSSSSTSSKSTSTSSTSSSSPTPTGPFTSNGNVNFTYYSCVKEPSAGKILPTQILNNGTGMTIEMCLQTCYNYKWAGVEYGRECWCANTPNFAGNSGATPAMNVSNSYCNFICPGNSTEYCGAGNYINLYFFNSTKAALNAGGSSS